MPPMTLVNATELDLWAERLDARSRLPMVIRKLVHATVKPIDRIDFRSDEGVQLPGWDGITSVAVGNDYVPTGIAGWELSARQDILAKANEDYARRSADPLGLNPSESTFVFVTLRSWTKKAEWIEARKREGVWRDVRAYDAGDLAAWLDLAPVVHISVSVELGKHPEGAL